MVKSLSPVIFYLLSTLKRGTAKVPALWFLRLNTLGDPKSALSTLGYDEHLCPFYMEVPPGSKIFTRDKSEVGVIGRFKKSAFIGNVVRRKNFTKRFPILLRLLNLQHTYLPVPITVFTPSVQKRLERFAIADVLDVFGTFGDNDTLDVSWIVNASTTCPSCNLPIFAGGHIAKHDLL